MKDKIKNTITMDPLKSPKKLFDQEVDLVRDTFGNLLFHFLLYLLSNFPEPGSTDQIEFDMLCPTYYKFRTNIMWWKRLVIPRYSVIFC